jgi:hypothetical protein
MHKRYFPQVSMPGFSSNGMVTVSIELRSDGQEGHCLKPEEQVNHQSTLLHSLQPWQHVGEDDVKDCHGLDLKNNKLNHFSASRNLHNDESATQ